ncbi:V-set domain-containing T-cell activation inhibitor 1-like [Narcine bancroftii]|uniref:V-set domain-containing T-cell activation inhibitor 1-like n=1 Tax=Narcine bancroftii TaxID=1343680 RepID=UPI003831F139
MLNIKTLLCSLLISSIDAFHLSCQQETNVEIGKDVTFECTFDCEGACDPAVKWEKEHVAGTLFEYRKNKSDFRKQNANYSGRIKVSERSINNGKAFLTLRNVNIWDEGIYVCSVSTDSGYGDGFVHLFVWAAPDIQVFWNPNSEVLSCQSSGWYPEPEVEWMDKHGNNLNKSSEIKVMRESIGFVNVSNNLKVDNEKNHYICSKWHKWIQTPKRIRVAFSDGKTLIHINDAKKSVDL